MILVKLTNKRYTMNKYLITVILIDGTKINHTVLCNCPIDFVVDHYHHDDIEDFTFIITNQ